MEGHADGKGHDGMNKKRYSEEKAEEFGGNFSSFNAQNLLKKSYIDKRFFGTCLSEEKNEMNVE